MKSFIGLKKQKYNELITISEEGDKDKFNEKSFQTNELLVQRKIEKTNKNSNKKGKIIDRTGEVRYNTYNDKMTIIKYINNRNVLVLFDNHNYLTNMRYDQFCSGKVSNPYDKTLCNIGYLGEGKYTTRLNGKSTKQYEIWHDMIKRCYNSKRQKQFPTYIECTVCEDWLNFQVFSQWYDENYYKIENEKMHLDKDILYKGNKVYSSESCIFVPERINTLFIGQSRRRGGYPIGVNFDKKSNAFRSRCSIYNNKKEKIERIELGYFNTPEEAFQAYKIFKEKHIKEVADYYKDKIPKKLYDAMYRYEIEIAD